MGEYQADAGPICAVLVDIAVAAAEIAQASTDPDDIAFWEGFSESALDQADECYGPDEPAPSLTAGGFREPVRPAGGLGPGPALWRARVRSLRGK